jgi:hypothetical protein
MKNVMNSMIFGFKEILTWNTMKFALISAIVVSIFWGFVGYMLWDQMILLSSSIIDLVPFSMIRSNGAWMLSTFLWFQLVIITFALIFAFFGNFILRSVSKEKYTSFSILVLIGSSLFWGVVWLFKGDYFYHEFLRLLTWLPFETVEKGIAFLIAFYFIYNAIIISTLFITSLFSEPLIASVEKRHFAQEEVVRDNVFGIVRYTLKDTLLYLLASIVAFPLLFIPVVNIFVQIVLWNYLVKDTLSYSAASLVYNKVEIDEVKSHKLSLGVISFVSVIFNFIPIFNFFGPFFGEISMYHYLKSLKK